MKIKFDHNIQYQLDAIKAVTDLFTYFKGNNSSLQYFTIKQATGIEEHGYANQLNITPLALKSIYNNLKSVQKNNKIEKRVTEEEFLKNKLNFTIQMETGTGKTYVFLRTIFELYSLYGLHKFIIIVPSIAIKEGIIKSFNQLKEEFKELYPNVNYINPIIYSGKDIGLVSTFTSSKQLSIMIMSIDSINKDKNVINRAQENFGGLSAKEMIKNTKPIFIIDEPQSVDGDGKETKSSKIIKEYEPLFILRYSATHKNLYNQVFELGPVESFEKKLVKEVSIGDLRTDNYNTPYVMLKETISNKQTITAKIEINSAKNNTLKRDIITVKKGDVLEDITKLEYYKDYRIGDIICNNDTKKYSIEVYTPNGIKILYKNTYISNIVEEERQRLQIRVTIKEHLKREQELYSKGIKVLSLFFLDEVKNYRVPGEKKADGIYAKWFEEEYENFRNNGKVIDFYKNIPAERVHKGYFAGDSKGKNKNSKNEFDVFDSEESAYEEIMKNKEKLLSFDSNTRFIFAHSALKEGWDNPNIFQICTLNDTKSGDKKRQEIGRGLRLCVNQNGERIHDNAVNQLLVMVNDSYENFVKTLQKEYEDDGIIFGKITYSDIENLDNNENSEFTESDIKSIFEYLKKNKYIDKQNKITDEFISAVQYDNIVDLPDDIKNIKDIKEKLKSLCLKKQDENIKVKDYNQKKEILIHETNYKSKTFESLWEKIKHKSSYKVQIDDNELKSKCIDAIKQINIADMKAIYNKANINIEGHGISAKNNITTIKMENFHYALPDIITILQQKTDLKRSIIVDILKNANIFENFIKNPQLFIEQVINTINKIVNQMQIQNIRYQKLDDTFDKDNIFDTNGLHGFLNINIIPSDKSIFNHTKYESKIEYNFAVACENSDAIEFYVKLPDNFKISTPVGLYNPDWAVVLKDNKDKIYFIVETKGDNNIENLKPLEKNKILCGKKHFEAVGSIDLKVADSLESFLEQV